jgi:hypothetical protein
MSIWDAFHSRWARIVGTVVFIFGFIKPFLSFLQWGLNLISEGQTAVNLWPKILAGVVWSYRGMPIWLNPILMVAGIALLIASRRTPRETAMAGPSPMPSPLKAPAARSLAVGRPPIPLVAVEAPQLPAIPEPTELADSDRPERADILFAHDSEKGLIWLKFLPDTREVNEDALLLIVFGYKLIRHENEVSQTKASVALHMSGCVNRRPGGIGAALSWMNYDPNVDVDEVGRACVSRDLLYKRGLRKEKGGIYILTERGARQALYLARDMIRRAD